jgi:hypothetical protein
MFVNCHLMQPSTLSWTNTRSSDQAEGVAKQVRGTAQDLMVKLRILYEIRQAAWTYGCAKRSKRSPTAIVALSIRWLLGRLHRPL